MPQHLAALTIVLLLTTVLVGVILLNRTGTRAMHFGKLDTTDLLIPPVALFYFYTLFATAFGWPMADNDRFFRSTAVAWLGLALCLGGVLVLLLSLVSFGNSFRVGIDADQPGRLVTRGIFDGISSRAETALGASERSNAICTQDRCRHRSLVAVGR
jgi:protein-S-isoprenylcysteine O-methyltransferase Ste14